MKKIIVLTLFVISAAVCGCTRKSSTEQPQDPFVTLQQLVDDQLVNGNIEEALAILDDAMEDPALSENRSMVFQLKASVLIQNGQAEEAALNLSAMAEKSLETAQAALPMVLAAVRQTGDSKFLLAWTEPLLELPFQDHVMQQLYVAKAYALAAAGSKDAAIAIIPLVHGTRSIQLCRDTSAGIITGFISLNQLDNALEAVETLASVAGDSTELKFLAAVSRVDVLTRQEKWEPAAAFYESSAASLDDSSASYSLTLLVTRMEAAGLTGELIKVCEITVEKRKPEERSTARAARHWLKAVAATQPEAAPQIMRGLIDKKIPASVLISIAAAPFYAVLDSNNPEKLQEMTDIVVQLLPDLEEKADICSAQSMIVDGNFILMNFDKALALVREGIEGRDENWQKSAISKLEAHKALAENRTADAVKHFRDFMNVISESLDKEIDPSTGLLYTAEWCVARNAKRIGDILSAAGNRDEAAGAYGEAKLHFEKALADFESGSREYSAITEELAQVPD